MLVDTLEERAAAIKDAEIRADNLSHILAEHMRRTIAAIDASLTQLEISNKRIGGPSGSTADWDAILHSSLSGLTSVNGLYVLNADGVIKHATLPSAIGRNMADRHLHQALAAASTDKMVADEPYLSRAFKDWVMPLGRRLNDPAGEFDGYVVGTLKLEAMRDFYRSIAVGDNGLIRILHPNGRMLFSEPRLPGSQEQELSNDQVLEAFREGRLQGSLQETFGPERTELITGYRALAQPVILIAVSLNLDEVLGTWRSRTAWNVVMLMIVVAAIVGSAWLLMRLLWARETILVEQRQREEERARAARLLQEANAGLERRVAEEVRKNREKDLVVMQQSRLAALGEMIGNIAHQWRQPLNSMSLVLGNLKDAREHGELNDAYLDEQIGRGQTIASSMSATIEDFRTFFRPDRDKQLFRPSEAVGRALQLMDGAFKSDDIEVDFTVRDDVAVLGFPNEYAQVVLNLLMNARDAIQARGGKSGKVRIDLLRDGEVARLVVADNGGGVPTEIIDKVFDPYFTTRDGGTGIGLYMSKTIIERNMGGRIDVRNTAEGATFSVDVPLAA